MNALRVRTHLLVLSLIAALLWPPLCEAQQPVNLPRVGLLNLNPQPEVPPPGSIRAALRDLGYVGGQNVVYELLSADFAPERLPALADELVRLRVDVIVAFTNPAAFAAKAATSRIPIVVWGAHAAVDTGLVQSLARPGGNLTGVESLAPELDAKRLEMLKEIVPGLAKVGVLYDAADQGSAVHLKSVEAASRLLNVGVAPLEVPRSDDFERAFEAFKAQRLSSLVTFTSALTFANWKRVADFALANRVPTACEFRALAQFGCLIAYGPTFDEFSQRTARQVDLILKGAKPADLPFEQVTRFELIVNMKTARALGITVPQGVLVLADEVVE